MTPSSQERAARPEASGGPLPESTRLLGMSTNKAGSWCVDTSNHHPYGEIYRSYDQVMAPSAQERASRQGASGGPVHEATRLRTTILQKCVVVTRRARI